MVTSARNTIRANGVPLVPRLPPLQLPDGFFVLQRGQGQYQALHEYAPGLFRAIGKVRSRRNSAAQDIYRYAALQSQHEREPPPPQS